MLPPRCKLYVASRGAGRPAGMSQGQDGELYTTNPYNGEFKVTPAGKLTVLHNFKGGTNDGYLPVGVLVQANDGNLYETTYEGGSTAIETIFKISTPPRGCLAEGNRRRLR